MPDYLPNGHTQKFGTDASDGGGENAHGENPPRKPKFTSFSANFEDVILQRIFLNRPTGFYVDIGAAHPIFESDTKLFYDRGWSGINIEPNEGFFKLVAADRPRDHNFCLAVAEVSGSADYYEVVGTGLSTCDEAQAKVARSKGYQVIRSNVPCSSLNDILSQASPSAIDFLKVDVEGFEEQVLNSNDWTKYRPSVVVVEATFPETPERRPTSIRADMKERGYRWRYFDGLNDFYVAEEFHVTDETFATPPNIFDGFRLRAEVDFEQHSRNLAAELANLAAELAEEKFNRHRLSTAVETMRKEIIAFHQEAENWHKTLEQTAENWHKTLEQTHALYRSSSSWALTKPYRTLGSAVRRLGQLVGRIRR